MSFAWFLVFVALMAGPSKGKKIRRTKSKRSVGRFTEEDFGMSESRDTVDWDAIANDDDDEVEGPIVKIERETGEPSAPIITYTRKKSVNRSGVQFNESVLSPQWGRQESARDEEEPAPAQPSTAYEGEPSQPTPSLDSIHHDHQRLMEEHAKLAKNFEKVATELMAVRKKLHSVRKMVKKIYSLIGCSSSIEVDSD